VNPGRAPGSSLPDVTEPLHGERTGLDAETAVVDAPPRRRPRFRLPSNDRSRAVWTIVGLLAILTTPLIVALAVLAQTRWYPILDLAMTELRVRDVTSSNPPLIGLTGRIGPLGRQGSHPGPLSFWALWPFYRGAGASSWGLEVGAVALHVLAMATAMWIAVRRGGLRLAVAVAALLAILLHAYGPSTMTQAWNPYMPVLWFVVFLLAVWSVIADDLPMLPVAVFAASFCAQTHVPYFGLTATLGVFAVAFAAWSTYRRRRNRVAVRRFVLWLLIAAGLAVVLWTPPVIDQIINTPGNLSVLSDYFRNPPEPPVGLRRAVEVLLVHLNPVELARPLVTPDETQTSGSLVPGSLALGVWVASVVVARRLRHAALLRLHLVVGVALVLALFSMSRIFGLVWFYLVLWAWGINALMLLAIGWTAAVYVGRRVERATAAKAVTVGTGALVGVVVLFSALLTYDATSVEVPAPRLSETLGVLAPRTIDALDDPSAPGGGRDGRYLVTIRDPVSIGATGYGLVNELVGEGFDVGVLPNYGPGMARHRVLDPADATGIVHLAVGSEIEAWRAKPGVREIAHTEPRTRRELAEYERLRTDVIDDLNAAGASDLVPEVDDNVFGLSLNTRVSEAARRKLARMADLGLPSAVFIGPREALS
jgi:hypothetical protein